MASTTAPSQAQKPNGWVYEWFYNHKISPNNITVVRIFMVPIIMVLVFIQSWGASLAAVIVFIIAAVTDRLDGELARRSHQITELGKRLDPLVDKLLVNGTLMAYAVAFLKDQTLPLKLLAASVVVMMAVEGASTLYRQHISVKCPKMDVGARWWGKSKLVLQVIIVAVLIAPFNLPILIIGILTFVVVTFTIASDIATMAELRFSAKRYRQSRPKPQHTSHLSGDYGGGLGDNVCDCAGMGPM